MTTDADADTDLESWVTPDGEELFVDFADSTRGSTGAFHAAYRRRDRTTRHGWLCSHCGSPDTAMDPMGTIECTRCGNRRKPTHWDAAYL